MKRLVYGKIVKHIFQNPVKRVQECTLELESLEYSGSFDVALYCIKLDKVMFSFSVLSSNSKYVVMRFFFKHKRNKPLESCVINIKVYTIFTAFCHSVRKCLGEINDAKLELSHACHSG